MPTFLVERFVPAEGLLTLAEALARADFRSWGVVHRGSVFIPGDEGCLCAFDAPTLAAVAGANHRAALPFERAVEAVVISGSWCGYVPLDPPSGA